jgi:hypothetical protein
MVAARMIVLLAGSASVTCINWAWLAAVLLQGDTLDELAESELVERVGAAMTRK